MAEYFYVIDYIEASLWTVTYMLIAFVGLINKNDSRLAMPGLALLTNFAWEVASIFEIEGRFSYQAGYIRLAWFVFDVFILIAAYKKNYKLPNFKRKFICWFIPWLLLTVIFTIGFKSGELFMPVSAWVIDVEMAFMFWIHRKKFDPSLRIYIGLAKLFGDIFAGIYCSPIHYSIVILAIISFVLNVMYVAYAAKELKTNPDINSNLNNNWQCFIKDLRKREKESKNLNRRRVYKKKKKVKKTHRKH